MEETRSSLRDYDEMITTQNGIRCSWPATERGLKEQATGKLESLSINSISSVLWDFRFVGSTQYIDTFFIWRCSNSRVTSRLVVVAE